MALVIPIEGIDFAPGRGPTAIIVIFTEENLQRMLAGDPFDMQLRNFHTIDHDKPIHDLDIIVAYEPKEETIRRIMAEGGIVALLAHVERNRIHQQDDALPPKSVKPSKLRPQ